jgi:23S rRNA pseudouridine2605 synthase
VPTERLQKFLSNAGIASRRRAETLISAGHVVVNGKVAVLGDKVDPDIDRVEVLGKRVKPENQFYYIAVNKPLNVISSRFDPQKRRSVYEFLPKDIQSKVWSIGRLDFKTEGLMLFTNDGDLTELLAHPRNEHEKEYEIQLNVDFDESKVGRLKEGIEIGENVRVAASKVKIRNKVVYLTINEGKKHQVRKMIEAIGYKVKSLKRIRMGKLELGDLPIGKYKFVEKSDIL